MSGIELSSLTPVGGSESVSSIKEKDLPAFRAEVDAFAAKAQAAGVQFGAPPFVLPETLDPDKLADALTFVFYKFSEIQGHSLSLMWRLVTAFAMDTPALQPLRAAGERIAADFDHGLGTADRNAYHNRQHTLEVMLCAHVLALIERRLDHPLFPEARLLLMLGALIHDWHHDGTDNAGVPFRLEDIALKAAHPYLTDLTPDQRLRLSLIVRATDSSGTHILVREALAWHLSGRRGEPPSVPPGMEDMAALLRADHSTVCELAGLLRDADALPSTGLTPDYAALNTSRITDEKATPLTHRDYVEFLNKKLGRPRRPTDTRAQLSFEHEGVIVSFASRSGQIFNGNLPEVVAGHAALLADMGVDEYLPSAASEHGIDLSIFTEIKAEVDSLGQPETTSLERVAELRTTLQSSGFFDDPPFTLTPRGIEKIIPGLTQNLTQETNVRINLAEQSADTLVRLHGVSGPLMSAVITRLFDTIGLRVDDPVYRAASGIAHALDDGIGTGTEDDMPNGNRNPYHNAHHILDIVLLSDLLGQRATQRKATASSPLARGLILLAALVCHWHHTGKGNRVDGEYRTYYLQDRALAAAQPYLADMSKELRQSLEILVRCTDPRDPYAFSRAAYSHHVGLGARPDVPAGCEALARLLGDPALCTLCARLNDVLYVPFAGLGAAYSARSIVQLGREIGQVIDFNFVRKNLITPMLSRPPYQGEQPPPALMLGRNRVASFTSAEAQAIFNPALHALLVQEAQKTL